MYNYASAIIEGDGSYVDKCVCVSNVSESTFYVQIVPLEKYKRRSEGGGVEINLSSLFI